MMDTVILRALKFDIAIGRDAWRRAGKSQPVSISLNILPRKNFEAAALEDDVNQTLDYGKLYKILSSSIKDRQFGNMQAFMMYLADVVEGYKLMNVDIIQPKGLLEATGGVHYHLRADRSGSNGIDATWSVAIKSLACACIVGVNPHERLYKQKLSFDIILGGVQPLDASVDVQAIADEGLHDLAKDIVEVSLLTFSGTALTKLRSEGRRFILSDVGGTCDSSGSAHHNGPPSIACDSARREAQCHRGY
jgi:dihydroneopterin aldolase